MRDFSAWPVNFGTTSAASTPRMTSTSSSSIRVNAARTRPGRRDSRMFDLRISLTTGTKGTNASGHFFTFRVSLNQVLEVEHRQQHADDDGADQAGHHEEHAAARRRRRACGAGGPGPPRRRRRGGPVPCRAGRSPRRRRSSPPPTGGTAAGCSPRLCDSDWPRCTCSMAWSTVSARVWLPIASRATLSDATSGTPAPTSVPSIRQKRTRAKWAMTRAQHRHGQERLLDLPPARRRSGGRRLMAMNATTTTRRHDQPVILHHVAGGDDELGQRRQVAAELGEDAAEPRDEEREQEDQHRRRRGTPRMIG